MKDIIKWLTSNGGYIRTSDYELSWTNAWNVVVLIAVVYAVFKLID